jgi:hypothetical protein
MLMFSRKKEQAVQGFLLKVVNNHCEELEALVEGPRLDGRVRLNVVVMVAPMRDGRPLLQRSFAAITKEFSTSGLSLIVTEARALDEVILGFRWESEMKYIRARAKHSEPIGAGFYQVGLQAKEVVSAGDYPELASLLF